MHMLEVPLSPESAPPPPLLPQSPTAADLPLPACKASFEGLIGGTRAWHRNIVSTTLKMAYKKDQETNQQKYVCACAGRGGGAACDLTLMTTCVCQVAGPIQSLRSHPDPGRL